LSRRERCLDNPKKLLKKARIGVMQKDWMKNDQASTTFWQFPTEAVTQSLVSALGSSGGCGGVRRLEFVAEFSGPCRWLGGH
jgi:hypothetical protein